MASIIVTRKHIANNISACFYLVDSACLGIKGTFFVFNIPFDELRKLMRKNPVEWIETSYEYVHNIIYASVKYAEQLGFEPHKDFSITKHFLEEDDDNIPLIEIKCGGKDGKPIYVNTGHETLARERQIINQLEKTAGEGNYKYMLIP